MDSDNRKKVKVLRNGPYQVSGNIPLNRLKYITNRNGASTSYELIDEYPAKETYFLCRCGKSEGKPFCDGSHLSGFDGKETAGHKSYEQTAKKIEGKFIDLMDEEELCAVARFCDTHGSTWRLVSESSMPETSKFVIQQCADCPSGRLTAVTKDGKIVEPELPQEISILEDGDIHGSIWVKGGIVIEDENEKPYPVRNRVTLCRCGKSKNKPFCDGIHMEVDS